TLAGVVVDVADVQHAEGARRLFVRGGRPGAPDGSGGPADAEADVMLQVFRVLAPNPGPFTLEGTNTWIVGWNPSAVIDPGPGEPAHLEAVARAAGTVGAILVTHGHPDHAPGAVLLAEKTGAAVMAIA